MTCALLLLFAAEILAAEQGTKSTAQKRATGAPKASDVCFSVRWQRTGEDEKAIRMAKAFHATRIDWVYGDKPQWIRLWKEAGYHFGGALNTSLPDVVGGRVYSNGRARDRNGSFVSLPWLPDHQHVVMGCANDPAYRDTFLSHARVLIDGGADSLHVDGTYVLPDRFVVERGACFCQHCRRQAREQNVDIEDQDERRKFYEMSQVEFYRQMRSAIDTHAGRHVPMSLNNYGGTWKARDMVFDYGLAELPVSDTTPFLIHDRIQEAHRLGKAQVFTIVSADVQLNRRAIATSYAVGGHVLVPWDVFLPRKRRHFGDLADYADLYGFVRAMSGYLDGYGEVAFVGPKQVDHDHDPTGLMSVVGSEGVCAAWRAQPEKEGPVVIHIVDWGNQPRPTRLRCATSNLPFAPPYRVVAFRPRPYDAQAHHLAEETNDYAGLVLEADTRYEVAGAEIVIDVPPATPWGLVVISKKED